MKTEEKATFTPGPWKYGKSGNQFGVFPVDGKGRPLMGRQTEDICSGNQLGDYDWEANARLMSAAPDLAEVARAALRLCKLIPQGHSGERVELESLAKAALKKAGVE
jgi:hypothetical protein